MKHIVAVMVLAGSLVGCASQEPSAWMVKRDSKEPKACQPLTNDQELVLAMSQDIASSGKLHAALANLERLPSHLPEARLRKAQLLRVLGRPEAESLYRGLSNTCLIAEAHHGLGQIEVARKDYPSALRHLRKATSLAPANDAMRNDLGVAYLNLDQVAEAHFELMTAMELNEGDSRAAQNLLTLFIYQDNWKSARNLVASKKLTTAQFKEAEKRARALQASHIAAQQFAEQPTQQAKEHTEPAPVAAVVPAQRIVQQPVAQQPMVQPIKEQPRVVQQPAAQFRPVVQQPVAQPVVGQAQVMAQQPQPADAVAQPVARVTQVERQAIQVAQPVPAAQPTQRITRGINRAPSAGARPIVPITGY